MGELCRASSDAPLPCSGTPTCTVPPTLIGVRWSVKPDTRNLAMNAIAKIDFHGQQLITVQHNNVPHVAMKPVVENIGLDWKSQHRRITNHPVLSTCMVVMTTQLPGDTQSREVAFLPIDYLNGWLFGVDVNRVREEIRDTLIQYQRECYQVLADYWNKGAAINPRKTLTPEMQRHIQELVTSIKLRKGIHWSTTYSKIKTVFQVGSYKDIRIEDCPALCSFLGGEPLEGEWLGKTPAANKNTIEVSRTNLNALVINAISAAELLKTIYPALRTLNSSLAPEMYSRTEDLHLCAHVMKRELVKQPTLT